VAVVDYRSSREIKNITDLMEKAGKKAKMEPSNWKKAAREYKALIVYDDGSCQLRKLSASTLVKRMRGTYQ
jgi:hypothetical protein